MKNRAFVILVALLLMTVSLVSAQDEAPDCQTVFFLDGWTRSAPEGVPTSAAYGTIINLGSEPDTLISAKSMAVEAAEIHEMSMNGDVMQMAPIEGGLMIPPGGSVEFMPGGLHIMLINPKQPIETDARLMLTLTFENAGDMTMMLPVRDIAAMGDMGMDMGDMSDDSDMSGMDMASDEAAVEDCTTDEAETCEIDMGGMGEIGGALDLGIGGDNDEKAEIPEHTPCSPIQILDPWARMSMPDTPTSAVYGLFANTGVEDDTLIAASSPVAELVEIHEMKVDEDQVMRMSPVEGGAVIPANGVQRFQPGGLHIMLINLTQELAVGDEISVTLTFEKFGDIQLTVPVRDPNMESGMGMDMGG